jgi:hypothetical protein
MAAGNQCDNCRAFGAPHSRSWLYLVRQPDAPQGFAALIGMPVPAEPLTFCSMLCVGQYAYVQAVTTSPAAGTEPPPAGTGWPS